MTLFYRITVSIFALALHFPATAVAQAYPEKPVRVIVVFPPGGSNDVVARIVFQKMSEMLGEQFVIDNRGGAAGAIGSEVVANSPADGYTLMVQSATHVANPHVYKKLPYDPQRDFQPITQLTEQGAVVVVHPSVPAKSIKEFIALAKSKPGQINYATTGTTNLLGIAHFKIMSGIDMVAIAYKGTGQAVISLISGEVQFFFMNPLVAVPHVKSGKLRALAVTSLTRNPALPSVPTVSESGVPGFQNINWHSIVVPAKTPKPIVKRLNAELVMIVNQPDVQARFKEQGLRPVGSTPEELSALIKKESPEIAKLVKQIGLEPQ